MIMKFQTSRRFVCSSIDRPSSVSHRIAASRRGQAGFSAAKSAPQFKFIIGLLQDLEMLGVGGHQTLVTLGPDHCKCPTQHQTESRSRCNLKKIILKQKQQEENKCPQQFVNVYNGLIRDSFLFFGQGVGPCHHQSPLPDQTKGINQVKLRISFDYAKVHH